MLKIFRKLSLKRLKNQAGMVAKLSKPIVTPTIYFVSAVFLVVSNIGLYATTNSSEPRFQGFFNFLFALIVLGAFAGTYIREGYLKWLVTDLDNKLKQRMINVYTKMNLTWSEASLQATENLEQFTYESILEFIEKYEK